MVIECHLTLLAPESRNKTTINCVRARERKVNRIRYNDLPFLKLTPIKPHIIYGSLAPHEEGERIPTERRSVVPTTLLTKRIRFTSLYERTSLRLLHDDDDDDGRSVWFHFQPARPRSEHPQQLSSLAVEWVDRWCLKSGDFGPESAKGHPPVIVLIVEGVQDFGFVISVILSVGCFIGITYS